MSGTQGAGPEHPLPCTPHVPTHPAELAPAALLCFAPLRRHLPSAWTGAHSDLSLRGVGAAASYFSVHFPRCRTQGLAIISSHRIC